MSNILGELERLHREASVYSFHSNSSEDAEWVNFIVGCQKHLPALIEVARAAEKVLEYEHILLVEEDRSTPKHLADLYQALEKLK